MKRALGFMNKALPITYNTYIGGVSATIGTASSLATKLGISVGNISNFSIVGSDIKCLITGSYGIPLNAFNANTAITYYKDNDGLVTSLGSSSFASCTNLAEIKFVNLVTVSTLVFRFCSNLITLNNSFLNTTTIGNVCFDGCSKITALNFPMLGLLSTDTTAICRDMTLLASFSAPNMTLSPSISISQNNSFFSGCINLTSVDLTSLNVIPENIFRGCSAITSISFPTATKINAYGCFYNCINLPSVSFPLLTQVAHNGFETFWYTKLAVIDWKNVVNLSSLGGQFFRFSLTTTILDIRSATTLGSSVLNNNVFAGMTAGTTLRANSFLQTNNSGAADGDVQDFITRGGTVVYF